VQQNNVVNRAQISKSRKTRNSSKNDAAFLYLSEKMNCENKYREEELRLKRKQHDDSIKLQEDVLDFKRAKLEFEERKWRDQAAERQMELERNDRMLKLLENVLMSGNLKK
jgi:hypothetical protein